MGSCIIEKKQTNEEFNESWRRITSNLRKLTAASEQEQVRPVGDGKDIVS